MRKVKAVFFLLFWQFNLALGKYSSVLSCAMNKKSLEDYKELLNLSIKEGYFGNSFIFIHVILISKNILQNIALSFSDLKDL